MDKTTTNKRHCDDIVEIGLGYEIYKYTLVCMYI